MNEWPQSKSANTLNVYIDKNICGFAVRENVRPENVEMFAIEINNCQTTRFRFTLYTVPKCVACKVEWQKSQKQTHAFIEK